jgi:hypothetical protein
LRRIHASRNPSTVRVLVDLGIVRDQGEGIPRMLAEMEGLFLPTPSIEPSEHQFRITLRNTVTLTADDNAFVASLGKADLMDLEFRALLKARRCVRTVGGYQANWWLCWASKMLSTARESISGRWSRLVNSSVDIQTRQRTHSRPTELWRAETPPGGLALRNGACSKELRRI